MILTDILLIIIAITVVYGVFYISSLADAYYNKTYPFGEKTTTSPQTTENYRHRDSDSYGMTSRGRCCN